MLVKFFNKKFIQKREPVKQILTKLPQHRFYRYHDMPYSFGRQWMYAGTKIIALCFFHQTGINVLADRIFKSHSYLCFFFLLHPAHSGQYVAPSYPVVGVKMSETEDFIKETQNLFYQANRHVNES